MSGSHIKIYKLWNFFKNMSVKIKASKLISEIKKGDKMKVDGKVLEVDAHYVLMEHKDAKGNKINEMAIELFDAKKDADFQIRYFEENLEDRIEFFELQGGFMYTLVDVEKIEW